MSKWCIFFLFPHAGHSSLLFPWCVTCSESRPAVTKKIHIPRNNAFLTTFSIHDSNFLASKIQNPDPKNWWNCESLQVQDPQIRWNFALNPKSKQNNFQNPPILWPIHPPLHCFPNMISRPKLWLSLFLNWHQIYGYSNFVALFTTSLNVLNKEKDSVPLSYNIQDGGGKG